MTRLLLLLLLLHTHKLGQSPKAKPLKRLKQAFLLARCISFCQTNSVRALKWLHVGNWCWCKQVANHIAVIRIMYVKLLGWNCYCTVHIHIFDLHSVKTAYLSSLYTYVFTACTVCVRIWSEWPWDTRHRNLIYNEHLSGLKPS